MAEAKPKSELISEEMVKAAEEEARAKKETVAVADGPKLRKKGGGPGQVKMVDSDIPYPEDIHGEDYEEYGPYGNAAVVPEGQEAVTYAADKEFYLDEEKLKTLQFDEVKGRNLPKKRLYTIKALHKDGRLVQLGFEDQIQNNAGGDPEDAIGLRRYQRKGITLLFNFETFQPIYCAAWGCWAQSDSTGPWVGFCSQRHAQHTLPNRYKEAGAIMGALMESGVTTSRTWSS